MFPSYAISRWRFTRGFEPDGDDFLYRPRPTASAIRISSTERAELLRAFRREYWRHQLAMLGAMFAALILLLGLGLLLPVEAAERFGIAGTVTILAPSLIAAFVLERPRLNLPLRQFSGRAPAAPRRGWLEAYNERGRRHSWAFHAIWIVLIAALAWLLFPRSGAAWWALPAWIAYFGLSLTVWIYNVWQKLNFASR